MTGSAFIVHKDGWSCSNEVEFRFMLTPVWEDSGVVTSVTETQVLNVKGIFNGISELQTDQKVEIVMKTDDKNEKLGFIGTVRSIAPTLLVINILTKTDRIKEILSNITFKN